jgi:hypothetical protein
MDGQRSNSDGTSDLDTTTIHILEQPPGSAESNDIRGKNMWKVLRDHAQGTSHKLSGTPCQDAEMSNLYGAGENEVLCLCCSDGAGSASLSNKGSETACWSLSHCIEQTLSTGIQLNQLTKEHIISWYSETAAAIAREAERLNSKPRELSCTLLGSIIGSEAAIFFQLGDGGIVIDMDGVYKPVFWPQHGEYVNETNFLTDSNLKDEIVYEIRQCRVNEIALFTDGLQPLVLDYSQKSAHAPFFTQMFKTLKEGDLNELHVPFSQFLDSERVNTRSDDDKTLILAVRI